MREGAATAAVCIILGLGVFAHEALYKNSSRQLLGGIGSDYQDGSFSREG